MQGKNLIKMCFLLLLILVTRLTFASTLIRMQLVTPHNQGKDIGTVFAANSHCGVLFTPKLHDLPPGVHGFHVHINPTCAENGNAAGGHLDPGGTNEHNGPFDPVGHLGDLPVLIVNADGTATLPILAPKLKLADIQGHALMIHAGLDNYADQPQKLGGGGERIACGIIHRERPSELPH